MAPAKSEGTYGSGCLGFLIRLVMDKRLQRINKQVSEAAKYGKPAEARPQWVTNSTSWDVRKALAGLAVAGEHNTAQRYL